MKKISRTVARQATLLAAVMLAAFSFSLTSCSDDDDPTPDPEPDPEAPDATSPQLEKIYWIGLDEDGVTPLEFFVYFTETQMIGGFYAIDQEEADYDRKITGEDIKINDILITDKENIDIIKDTETSGKIVYESAEIQYELSDDGKYLTTNVPGVYSQKYIKLGALNVPQGKVWDFSGRSDIEW